MHDDDDPNEGAVDLDLARRKRGDWTDNLSRGDRGGPKASLANGIEAFRKAPEWRGVLAFNMFTSAVVMLKAPPWERQSGTWPETEWVDLNDIQAADWLQRQGIQVGVVVTGQAVQVAAYDHCFHPVRDRLDALTWDVEPRLDNWLVTYLGVEATRYARAVGRRFLLSSVARVYAPGCMADSVLVAEGPQGQGKSSALRVMYEPWFSDELADLKQKDAAQQTRGVWLIELAEYGTLPREDIGRVKAFVSRREDRYRPPYGRRVATFPRQAVFAATVNEARYLGDPTGNRRWWPVKCRKIHLDDLQRDRDQLWAEAVHMYRRGDPWWLETKILQRMAESEQAERYQDDPWDMEIEKFLNCLDQRDNSKYFATIPGILKDVLHILPSRQTQRDQNRVARYLISIGWERKQVRAGSEPDKDGKIERWREWQYRPGPAAVSLSPVQSGDSGESGDGNDQ